MSGDKPVSAPLADPTAVLPASAPMPSDTQLQPPPARPMPKPEWFAKSQEPGNLKKGMKSQFQTLFCPEIIALQVRCDPHARINPFLPRAAKTFWM